MNIMHSPFNKHSRFGGGDPAALDVKKPKNMSGGMKGYPFGKGGKSMKSEKKPRKV